MFSRKYIENLLRESIIEVTGIKDIDSTACLIGKELPIAPASFLDIFALLEKKSCINVYKVFEYNTAQVMTISNLTEAFYNIAYENKL